MLRFLSRHSCTLASTLLLAFPLILSGCGSNEDGVRIGQATLTFDGDIDPALKATVTKVFREQGALLQKAKVPVVVQISVAERSVLVAVPVEKLSRQGLEYRRLHDEGRLAPFNQLREVMMGVHHLVFTATRASAARIQDRVHFESYPITYVLNNTKRHEALVSASNEYGVPGGPVSLVQQGDTENSVLIGEICPGSRDICLDTSGDVNTTDLMYRFLGY